MCRILDAVHAQGTRIRVLFVVTVHILYVSPGVYDVHSIYFHWSAFKINQSKSEISNSFGILLLSRIIFILRRAQIKRRFDACDEKCNEALITADFKFLASDAVANVIAKCLLREIMVCNIR